MFIAMINSIINQFSKAVIAVLSILPSTPFNWTIPPEFADILGAVNYFIPFATILTFMIAYVGAVVTWYLLRWLLRFVRYIQ